MWKATPGMLAALLILETGSAARAQTAAPPSPAGSLEQEMKQLNRSVQELVALLRDYLAHQDVDLLLKRVEIGLQKIGPLNQELASLRAQNLADEEQLGKNRSALTAIQTREAEAEGGTSPDPQVTTDDSTRRIQLDAEIKRLRRRISETEQIEVEGKLAQEQRDLQQWETLIDRRLGQR